MQWNKKFIKNQRREQTQNKLEEIKQDYIKIKDTINIKRKKNNHIPQNILRHFDTKKYVFSLQINNLKNEVKPIAKKLISNPKNEHENNQISICRKTKKLKRFKE